MPRTQIYLPKSQITTLQKIAHQRDDTVSGIIRLFIQERLDRGYQREKIKSRKTLFTALREVRKYGEKGPRDLSRRMDSYLYGA